MLISLKPRYFEPDFELVRFGGQATCSRQLEEEIREFHADHRNRGLWRAHWKQRVSSHRLRRIFRDTMTSTAS